MIDMHCNCTYDVFPPYSVLISVIFQQIEKVRLKAIFVNNMIKKENNNLKKSSKNF